MRLLIFILLICGMASAECFSQLKSSFSSGLFKTELTEFNDQPSLKATITTDLTANMAKSALLDLPRTKPGIAFLSSAILPGSGQAANGKWVRAGIYFTVELAGWIYHLDRNAKARRQERAYIRYTHQNWSVLAYSRWLVEYSQFYNLNNGWQDLQAHISGKAPDFSNTVNDWAKVDIDLLHEVEKETPFIFNDPQGCMPGDCRRASNFSHELPNYGSQQFYELISKYYQFQPGWRDYYNTAINGGHPSYNPDHILAFMSNGQHMPFDLFYQGRDRAEIFNDNYRAAGNILKLLLVNHVVSAFDALFTVQLKNSRIESDTNLLRYEQFSLTWYF